MKPLLRIVVIAAVALTAGIVSAQSLVGTWHGRMHVDRSNLPKPKNAQEKQLMQKQLQQLDASLAKATMTLNLTVNKMFFFIGQNIPGVKGHQTDDGTYVQSGKTLSLTSKTKDGKPVPAGTKPQVLAIGEGGKSLTLLIPNGNVKIAMVFSR